MVSKRAAVDLAELADRLAELSLMELDFQFVSEGRGIWDDTARNAIYHKEYKRRGYSIPQ